jgi:hypothetical protein
MSNELASRFHKLFAGLERAYGTYNNISQEREDGKLKGDAVTVRQPVTDALWQAHLEGKNGVGIIPIRDDNTVVFGAIDIDRYDLDTARVAALVARLEIPLVPCRSKSGGIHAYLFCKQPVPATKMVAKLREISAMLGYGMSEVFPKQIKLAENGLGSWINAPYADADHTTRYALRPNGDAMDAEAFLEYAEQRKVDQGFFDKPLLATKVPKDFKDAPPCLATLVQVGFPQGARNTGLYNMAVFARRSCPDAWEKLLYDFNERFMQPPLSSGEVQQTIQSFRAGKDYWYRCSDVPIAPHCNAVLCRTRKYGVGGGKGVVPDFGPLAQQPGDEVLWYWSVNGRQIRLTTDQLFRFNKFRERCAEELRMVVPSMTQAHWDDVIARAMENCELIQVAEDATRAFALWELVEEFCSGPGTFSMAEVLAGSRQPYAAQDGRTYFSLSALMQFLQRRQFKEMKRGDVPRVLKQHGGMAHRDNVGQKDERSTRHYWSIPTPPKPAPLDLPPEDGEDRPAF